MTEGLLQCYWELPSIENRQTNKTPPCDPSLSVLSPSFSFELSLQPRGKCYLPYFAFLHLETELSLEDFEWRFKKNCSKLGNKQTYYCMTFQCHLRPCYFKCGVLTISVTWELVKMQIFRTSPRPIESEFLGSGPRNLYFYKVSEALVWRSLPKGPLTP